MDSFRKNNQKYSGIYQDLIDLLGIQAVNKIYTNFKGQQIVLPMRLYTRGYVLNELKRRYNGKNLGLLALEFGYTERYLRTLLKEPPTFDNVLKEEEISLEEY